MGKCIPPTIGETFKHDIKINTAPYIGPATRLGKKEIELLHYLQSLEGYRVDVEHKINSLISKKKPLKQSSL